MNPLILLALQQTPAVIGYLKVLFTKAQPDGPVPTDAEVIAAFESAFASSLAKDDAWLLANRLEIA